VNLCGVCGLDFSTVPDFDGHRVGTHDYTYSEGLAARPMREDGRRCLDRGELVDAGWTADRSGRWRRPRGRARTEDDLARLEFG
jgi:hypothetical protein